jgi:acetate kinase
VRVLVVNAGSSSLKLRLLDDSDARTLVITAREDLQIAHETRLLLTTPHPP